MPTMGGSGNPAYIIGRLQNVCLNNSELWRFARLVAHAGATASYRLGLGALFPPSESRFSVQVADRNENRRKVA